jgi:hypothetical protein
VRRGQYSERAFAPVKLNKPAVAKPLFPTSLRRLPLPTTQANITGRFHLDDVSQIRVPKWTWGHKQALALAVRPLVPASG